MKKFAPYQFYVYQLVRPWNGVPCYVGKGQDDRVLDHGRAGVRHGNRHLANIYKRAGGPIPFDILMSTDEEPEAFKQETNFIISIGRADLKLGPLCNLTNGGEGSTGMVLSEEQLARRGDAIRAALALLPSEWRSARAAASWSSLSVEERALRIETATASQKVWWATASPSQREARLDAMHSWRAFITPEMKLEHLASNKAAQQAWWGARTTEQLALHGAAISAGMARAKAKKEAMLKDGLRNVERTGVSGE